jgi:type II secretory pathway component PulL
LPKLVIDKADVDTFNRLFPEEKRAKTLQLELNKRISEIERKIKLNDLYAGEVKKYLQNFNDHIQ